MQQWEENINWRELGGPIAGEIVHLKLNDGFIYLIKALVTSTINGEVNVRVDAIFDCQTKNQITGGEITQLINKDLTFKPCFIHDVYQQRLA